MHEFLKIVDSAHKDVAKIDLLCEKFLLQKIKSSKSEKTHYNRISSNDQEITCSICLDLFKEGLYKRTLTCGHVFHKKCIDKWITKDFQKTCPICRGR